MDQSDFYDTLKALRETIKDLDPVLEKEEIASPYHADQVRGVLVHRVFGSSSTPLCCHQISDESVDYSSNEPR